MINRSTAQTQEVVGLEQRTKPKPVHRILVVDDDQSILRLNAEALMRYGYQVDAAADGSAAWQALRNEQYDLLITDNRMPNVSGVELIKKVRSAHMTMPVIMATGVWPTEEMLMYPWLQPVTTLLKPYAISELLGTVRQALYVKDASPEQTMQQLHCQMLPEVEQRVPIRFL